MRFGDAYLNAASLFYIILSHHALQTYSAMNKALAVELVIVLIVALLVLAFTAGPRYRAPLVKNQRGPSRGKVKHSGMGTALANFR